MPLHMRFEAGDLLRCRFGISPLWETHQCLYTLLRPERHGYHLPWLRRHREAAAELDLAALSLLVPADGYHPDFLAGGSGGLWAERDPRAALTSRHLGHHGHQAPDEGTPMSMALAGDV
ncbi:hypothetical protein [Streptomyces sp. URMC 124]|uniref:hypothetical protein n=1 Tax=Streptomyces sp. URMC 124 TaxID=3423405 RepID=UPI003F1D897D